MNIEETGEVIGKINVEISYKIIELFSAGLYSSPNKAFEELICNSYDANASKVSVFLSDDLNEENAFIWVCDNGDSMDANGLRELWKIGESSKRKPGVRHQRLQIGKFGIGKLATYVLARKLTYLCKKDNKYLAVTMDYNKIGKKDKQITLDEREIDESEAKLLMETYIEDEKLLSFDLFGEEAEDSWTFSILTQLKTKATEIKKGILKWILRTAIPLNPSFNLKFNGEVIQSSKIERTINKKWIIGKDDQIADKLPNATSRVEKVNEDENYFVDFENVKNISGYFELYEDSLVDGSKSSDNGRSHGIFLMVRGRLVNLNDPLLGMDALTHGVFNRTRVIINADELDKYLTSARENIKESKALSEITKYIQKKFNSELKPHHFESENNKLKQKSISYRISQTPLTISKRPLYVFVKKFKNGDILNPKLIKKPKKSTIDSLIQSFKDDLTSDETIIKETSWVVLESTDPIAKLDLESGVLSINLLHPLIANYHETFKSRLPLEFFAITEVLTEAHLYEIGIDETLINEILDRRDETLRELSYSDRDSAPLVAQILNDSLDDSGMLEEAVFKSLLSLGFKVTKIGGNGKPDGKADAFLGYGPNHENQNYSLTYDAKSTKKQRIAANTTNMASLNRHKEDYGADFVLVVAVDYEGGNDPTSALFKMAKQQKVTVMRASDLIRLLLLSSPKQIGLNQIKELFENCHTPLEVKQWIDNKQEEEVEFGPIKEILDIIYKFQSEDTEQPEIASIRIVLNSDFDLNLSKEKIKSMIQSLISIVPGFISIDDEKVGINGSPEKIMEVISAKISGVPSEMNQVYLDAFTSRS